jgi:hypothetical protein
VFLFKLQDSDGADVGLYRAAVPNWQEGDLLYEGGWPAWRVTAVGGGGEQEGESVGGCARGRAHPVDERGRAYHLFQRRAAALPLAGAPLRGDAACCLAPKFKAFK